jgi:hypothetical protein
MKTTTDNNVAEIITTAHRLGFRPSHSKLQPGPETVLRYSYPVPAKVDEHGNVRKLEITISFYTPGDFTKNVHAQLTWVEDHLNFAMIPFDVMGDNGDLVSMEHFESTLLEYIALVPPALTGTEGPELELVPTRIVCQNTGISHA